MSARGRPSSSTPGPSPEDLNYVDALRPFKTSRSLARAGAASRRTRNLKQILTTERELAMGINPSAPSKKKKQLLAPKTGPGGRKLTGAAAKAAARRREAEAAAAAAAAAASAGRSAAPSVDPETGDAASEGGDSREQGAFTPGDDTADVSMAASAAESVAGDDVGEEEAQVLQAAQKNLIRYHTVEAPPSLRPRKKYCDITGLIAPYTDPKTRLQYHSAEIYGIIKTFGPGVDQTYLGLRGDSSAIK